MNKETDSNRRSPGRSGVGARILGASSFICGACVMVLEMAGSRLVAPYMGTSLVVWTSLIGVIMASLTLGYWAGGRTADRRPDPRLLAKIIAGAALWSAGIGVAAPLLMTALSSSVQDLYAMSFVAAIVLFAVPSVLLGMVSPFIVRLAMSELGSAGTTVGKFSALSNAGSILGTFLGGFVLISFMSSRSIVFFVAAALAFVAVLLHAGSRASMAPLVAVAVSLLMMEQMGVLPTFSDGMNIETRYNTVRITDTTVWHTKREVRLLQTDPLGSQSVMYLDSPAELYSDYTKFYDLAFHFRPQTKRVLMLGGGGYCVPRHITATRPDVEVDVVELDPGITQIARDYFHLEDRPGQRIFHEDARVFVNRASEAGERYDAIFEDVFGSEYTIPFHMTTTECMGRIYDMLDDGGVLVINIIAEISGGLFAGIYASVAEHFQSMMIFPATFPNSAAVRQNVMIVAIKSETIPERAPSSDRIARLLAHRWTAPYRSTEPAFTDAFAPVEKYALMR